MSTATPTHPMSPADVAAHAEASYVRRTAPLPLAAVDAMRSLERKLAPQSAAKHPVGGA